MPYRFVWKLFLQILVEFKCEIAKVGGRWCTLTADSKHRGYTFAWMFISRISLMIITETQVISHIAVYRKLSQFTAIYRNLPQFIAIRFIAICRINVCRSLSQRDEFLVVRKSQFIAVYRSRFIAAQLRKEFTVSSTLLRKVVGPVQTQAGRQRHWRLYIIHISPDPGSDEPGS